MTISINDVLFSTDVFIAIFTAVFLVSIGKQKNKTFFSSDVSQELKGFAILAIVFSHIGYFLVTDHRFLFPLSIMAGVGVDLFLILSGFGITMSAFGKNLTARQFYEKRLLRLFVPFWIVIFSFFFLDFFVLGKSYGLGYMFTCALGLFPRADLYSDVNSPLWYFTFTLFYYLVFPLVFRKKYYWVSALGIFIISSVFIESQPHYFSNVLHLYELHIMAFPLGMILAGAVYNRSKLGVLPGAVKKILKNPVSYGLLLFTLFLVAGYFSYNSGVGTTPLHEELISVIIALAILGIFLIKRFDSKLLSLFGLYSYEIYLLHWPIMYRYDIFYKWMPAWLATISYMALFIVLGWLLKKAQEILLSFSPRGLAGKFSRLNPSKLFIK